VDRDAVESVAWMGVVAKFAYNLGLGLDQFVNVLLLGDPDESLSGRLGRALMSGRPKWWVRPLAKANDWLWYVARGEVDHCLNAVELEEQHAKELWSWIKG
jgi:hypothetical protein